jgi:glutathione synthase/RimK-type ligase-like ATP-grasp enzyme
VPADVVLASCAALPCGDGGDDDLVDALLERGLAVRWAPWDAPGTGSAGLVVLRATWDYPRRCAEFLAWVDGVEHLANPAAAVRWSAHKRYLLDLAADGVPVLPTAVFAPGADVVLPDGEVVVKPAVGAGSHGAARFTEPAAALAHARTLHARGHDVVVQPFEPSVDTAGETVMVLVRGRPSHAFHKGAMLPAPGAAAVAVDGSGLFTTERLGPLEPPAAAWAVAELAVAAAARRIGLDPADLLYARVDVLGAQPRVLEVELVEPSLGWRQVPDAQRAAALSRFVDAVVELLASRG